MSAEEKQSFKVIIIISLIMILLQGANLVGVAINRSDITHMQEQIIKNESKYDFVASDYTPMWFMEGLQQNNDFMIQELVARLGGDKQKAKEVAEKYEAFKKTMIENMIKMRGGISTTTRGVHITQDTGNGGS